MSDTFLAQVGGAIAFAIIAAVSAWLFAPAVGGELWPYIRVGVTLVAAWVGLYIGAILGLFGLLAKVVVVGS